jgi:hypothetical protein
MVGALGQLLPEVERDFRSSKEWRRFEADLLALAAAATLGPGQLSDDDLQLPAEQRVRAAEGGFPEAKQTGVTEPSGNEPPRTGADRRAAVDAYIEEVFNRTGKRITRTDIWKSARYKSRTEFERWERNDLEHPNKTANQRFTGILAEKPHLK